MYSPPQIYSHRLGGDPVQWLVRALRALRVRGWSNQESLLSISRVEPIKCEWVWVELNFPLQSSEVLLRSINFNAAPFVLWWEPCSNFSQCTDSRHSFLPGSVFSSKGKETVFQSSMFKCHVKVHVNTYHRNGSFGSQPDPTPKRYSYQIFRFHKGFLSFLIHVSFKDPYSEVPMLEGIWRWGWWCHEVGGASNTGGVVLSASAKIVFLLEQGQEVCWFWTCLFWGGRCSIIVYTFGFVSRYWDQCIHYPRKFIVDMNR